MGKSVQEQERAGKSSKERQRVGKRGIESERAGKSGKEGKERKEGREGKEGKEGEINRQTGEERRKEGKTSARIGNREKLRQYRLTTICHTIFGRYICQKVTLGDEIQCWHFHTSKLLFVYYVIFFSYRDYLGSELALKFI